MNWYKASKSCETCNRLVKEAATGHCLDRIDGRLKPYANDLRASVDAAEDLYGKSKLSIAVCVKELPKMVAMNKWNDTSNGDWVVAILRPFGWESECKTLMLRRSPKHPSAPQPFTTQALRVDKVITYQQFQSDIQKAYTAPSPTQPSPTSTPEPSLPV